MQLVVTFWSVHRTEMHSNTITVDCREWMAKFCQPRYIHRHCIDKSTVHDHTIYSNNDQLQCYAYIYSAPANAGDLFQQKKDSSIFSILSLRHTHSARPMHTAHCNTRSHWLNYMEEKWLGWWTAYAIDTWSVFIVVVSTLWMCWFVQKVDVEYGDKSWLSPITIPYPKRGHFSLLPFFFLFFVLLRWVSSSTSSMALILFFYISWTRTLLSLSRRDTMPESTIIAEHTFNISAWRRLFPAYLSK